VHATGLTPGAISIFFTNWVKVKLIGSPGGTNSMGSWERLCSAVRSWGNYTAWLLQRLGAVQSRLRINLRLYQQLLAHAPSLAVPWARHLSRQAPIIIHHTQPPPRSCLNALAMDRSGRAGMLTGVHPQ
jgi:hypothetical protein